MKRIMAVLTMAVCVLALSIGIASAIQADQLKGKVLETLDSGGYTYCQIDAKGEKVWVAVPQTKVEKGKVASFQPGMLMENFKSKTLNRTFDKVYFSGGMNPAK